MRRNQTRGKRAAFTVVLILSLLTVGISTPADEIMPAPPSKQTAAPTVAPAPQVTQAPTASMTEEPTPVITEAPTPVVAEEATPIITSAPTPEPLPDEEEAAAAFAPAPPEETSDPEADEDYLGEPEGEPDPNVEPDEELAFMDELANDTEATKNSLAAVNGMTNILLIGLDARPGETTGRSDTMIILTLDADNNGIKMTSLMRDLYVEIPGRKNNRLNSAYVYGGPELLMQTIEANFGIEIDHYVAVNFSVLADVIDQIGGLTLTVESRYVKRINAVIKQDNKVLRLNTNDGLLSEGGEQLLTGKQAQAYARYRYGTSDGDFGRTVRQREVILKALNKVKSLSMAELARLALNNMGQISTDMALTEMIQLAPALFQLSEADIQELRIPIDGGYSSRTISGMSVLVPDRTKNRQAISDFLLAK